MKEIYVSCYSIYDTKFIFLPFALPTCYAVEAIGSSITFIDAKIKYRSPYLMDVSKTYL